MAIQLGSAYGKVALDVAGLLTGVAKGKAGLTQLAQVGVQVGNTMKGIGNAMTVGITLPIVAMGAASIKAASDFEETKNKAVVVFGEMSDSVVSNANRAGTALGMSKTQYLDYASSIGAALTAGGMGVAQASELAEQAVKHFADLASFHNSSAQDAAMAWQSAIRGQYEPIQKYFPFINDAYIKTYGTANGMLDENTKTLTANQRAMILNAIALNEELNPALNDFAETAGGLANQGRIFQAEWNNALIMLGQNLLPIALQVVTALNKMLESINNMEPHQQKMILGFAGLLAIMGPVLSVVGSLITIISSIAGLAGTLGTMGISLAGVGTGIAGVGAAIAAAAVPILVIVALLVGLALTVGLVVLAWRNNWFHFRDIVQTALANVKSLFASFKAVLRGDTEEAAGILQEMFERVMGLFEKIFGAEIVAKFRETLTGFITFLSSALGRIRDYIARAFQGTNWSQLGRAILYGIASGMLAGVPALLATAMSVANAVLAQIKRSLGISSPSKAFMELGRYSAQGYQLGLARAMSAEDVSRNITKPLGQMMNSNQQTINMNFASGLTQRDVRGMIEQNQEALLGQLTRAMGGA
jgi:hypothetical protein